MGRLSRRFPRYSKLLRFYPAGYRKEYGEQMLQTLADMLDDPAQSKSKVWTRTVLDFPLSVARQQLAYAGDASAAMPRYLKQNARLGAWLVAPFFLFVLLATFFRHTLENSVFWHTRALYIWLIVLPSVAIILNAAALLRWLNSRRRETKLTLWKLLTDFRHNWPALAIVLIGLGILAFTFGHDSVHCVTGNPIRVAHNPHQTLQCILRR